MVRNEAEIKQFPQTAAVTIENNGETLYDGQAGLYP